MFRANLLSNINMFENGHSSLRVRLLLGEAHTVYFRRGLKARIGREGPMRDRVRQSRRPRLAESLAFCQHFAIRRRQHSHVDGSARMTSFASF